MANPTNEELVVRIKAGIDMADNMLSLWQQNKRYIRCVAKKYARYADIEDLEQEGYLALYDAIDGYSSEKGTKFLTYASYWIEQKMMRYIQNNGTVRIPVNELEKVHELKKMVNAFLIYLGRKPTRQEIAYNMRLSYKEVGRLEESARMGQIMSLEAPLPDEVEGAFGDTIASDVDVESDVLDNIEKQQLYTELWYAVEELPEEQCDIIRMKYKEGHPVKEIGKITGMTGGKVRRLEEKALRELRYSERLYSFSNILPDAAGSGAYYGNVGSFNRTWTSSTERVALKLSE